MTDFIYNQPKSFIIIFRALYELLLCQSYMLELKKMLIQLFIVMFEKITHKFYIETFWKDFQMKISIFFLFNICHKTLKCTFFVFLLLSSSFCELTNWSISLKSPDNTAASCLYRSLLDACLL